MGSTIFNLRSSHVGILHTIPVPHAALYADEAQALGLSGVTGNVTCVATADFLGEAHPSADYVDDLVVGADSAAGGAPSWRVKVFNGTPSGYVEAATLPDTSDRVSTLAAGDVDNDGDADIFVGTSGAGSADRLYLKGAGWTFTEAGWGPAGTGSTTIAKFADMDADGKLDLCVVEDGVLKAYRNTGASFVDSASAWGLSGLTGVTGLAIADCNADGLPFLRRCVSKLGCFFEQGVWSAAGWVSPLPGATRRAH